jgi:hypothetical protein
MRRPLVVAAIALLTAACGASSAADQASGTLKVTQHINGHLYVEGSVGYVKIVKGGKTIFEGRIGDGVSKELSPGTYQLDSYQNLCIGNCGHLGPPIDKCSTTIAVNSDQTTSAAVELTPESNSCTISTS